MMCWQVKTAEQQMEIEGDEEHDNLNAKLLQEVSLPLTAIPEPIPFNICINAALAMSIPQSSSKS